MKPSEKDQIMNDFATGEITILVSTTVIEVWVDIREATMMIIKNAERFWLAQLHQLRGRIGRNDLQSYCFLETKSKSGDSYERLQAMEQTNDGFKLAEIDLKFRGAGEVLGTRQSWEADIPPEIISDLRFIQKVRDGAIQLLDTYPGLEWLPALQKFVEQKMGDMIA
jgi:ATP-dependent DNA helicase RecG